MDWSQSLNAPPYFDDSNYAFWKVRMRAFLCSIDEPIWDAVEIGWTRLEAAKSTWDKAALVASNANSKALNAIFCGVSPNEFHALPLPRRHGKYWRPCTRERRKLKTPSCRC